MIINHQDKLAQADGFIGSIFAIEGIVDSATILNGPTGCKFYIGEAVHDQYRRNKIHSEMEFAEEFYFQQPRVPCTYLDDYDYVFGASEKLEYVFGRVATKGGNFIGVVNSPGASLIGDDLDRYVQYANLDVPTLIIENPNYTKLFETGWVETAKRIIKTIDPVEQPAKKTCVNFVGLSIWQRYWSGSCDELKRLLALCGIEVQSVLIAGSTVEEIRNLRRAAANVVVHDELGSELADYLQTEYGQAKIASPLGVPVGFEATNAWLNAIGESLGVDMTPALNDVARTAKKAAEKIYRFSNKTGLPKAASVGIVADASLAYPLLRWCLDYLGMTPVALQVPDEKSKFAKLIQEYLAEKNLLHVWNKELNPEDPPNVVLANDAVIMRTMADDIIPACFDIEMPAKSVQEFLPRSLMGPTGALWILEGVLNGLWILISEEG